MYFILSSFFLGDTVLTVYIQDIKPAKEMWVMFNFQALLSILTIFYHSVDELVTTAANSLKTASSFANPKAKL